MTVKLDTKLIDPNDPKFQTMLKNLQGNILQGHGRDHSVLVFLEFSKQGANLRKAFHAIASRNVTSALHQRDEASEFVSFGIPGGTFGNVLLTAKGYLKLGIKKEDLGKAFPEQSGVAGEKSNFKEGLLAHSAELNDPKPTLWEKPYQAGAIDAMLLLADDDEQFLLRKVRQLLDDIEEADIAQVVTVERGNALRNKKGDGVEHFGYVDGRSQPIYYTTDLEKEGTRAIWDPSEPLSRILVPDVLVKDADSFGSYMVFRKLEQNVRGFKVAEQNLADALKLVDEDRERAGAMAVGRFEDGTPLVLSSTDGFATPRANDFTYAADPDGLKCPFQAHIRKANPRGDVVRKFKADEESGERAHRITRRGIPYGKRDKLPGEEHSLDELPTAGVGLLFMCFQSSIANQFAFMQRTWVNNEDFVVGKTGLDPVIGQAPAVSTPINQGWHPQWGQNGNPVPFSFDGFVSMKGGEFFFAPSIPFIDSLGN